MSDSQPGKIATGISYGALAKAEHAHNAVDRARSKMAPCTVGSVLLFLTTGYAQNPQNAIREAAKAAGTPQVFGCCAVSLLTEEEWLLDAEGAVAMVFPQGLGLQPQKVLQHQGINSKLSLTLTSPNAATIAVNACAIPQIGAISSDHFGHGPFSVWQSGRIIENEYTHLAFSNEWNYQIGVGQGITSLSPVMQVNRSQGHVLLEVDQMPATDNLLSHLPENLHAVGLKQPYNLLCAVSENNSLESIELGHYKLQHIVSTDESRARIHLSGSVKAGRHIFWALRDEQHAQRMMRESLLTASSKLTGSPVFGLMFPNIGRGAEFFNGRDRDIELFQEIFPDTPLLGFYGNGEIAPGHKLSGLIHHYSTVFAVFA